MNKPLLIAFLLSSTLGISQTRFEQGYFIDNNGRRLECLIRNEDWSNSPVQFSFRENEASEVKRGNIESTMEFGFTSGARYIRKTVDIDFSSDVDEVLRTVDGPISELSIQRDPEWKRNQVVFLKVLVAGNANLYYWYGENRDRYFYSVSDSHIEQLVYKQYLMENPDKRTIESASINKPYSTYLKALNTEFKVQLFKNVNCGNLSIDEVRKLKYNRDNLRKYFVKFNTCSGSTFIDFDQLDKKRETFHLTLRPGLDLSSFEIYTPGSFSTVYSNFPTSPNFRLGFEVEYFLQTNRNRWSLFIEPTYRTYAQENQRGALVDKVSYTSIELPMGIRYNAYFGDASKFFMNLAFVMDFPLSSQIVIQNVRTADISSSPNFAFGAGYARKKLSMELRFFTGRNLQKDYVSIPNSFRTFSIIFGYRLN